MTDTKITPLFVAKVCHSVLREYSSFHGDASQPEWHDISQDQKDTSVHNVQFVIDNPKSKPHLLHENWLREKAALGWSYGAERNPNLKQDPRFDQWHMLPDEHKIKDHLFVSMVRAMTDDSLEKPEPDEAPDQKSPDPEKPVRRIPKPKKEKKAE